MEDQMSNIKERERKSMEGGMWGMVVVFAAFTIQVIVFGTSQSIGLYNIEFLRTFDTGAAAVSLVGSINLGMLLGAGPICSILMAKWSHRQVALLGAALCNIGLIFMPFAPNLPYMYAFYGILGGLGYSLTYVPSHILSGLYYSKHRSLSTGVATAGSGLGSTVFPIILYNLIQYYGWRGSLLILTGLNLHLFIFAALLRPVPKALLKRYSLKEKGIVESEKLVRMDSDAANVYQEKPVEKCENEIKKNSNGMKHEDNSSTPLHQTNNPLSDDMLDKSSISQRLINHFKMVFTFDFVIYFISNIGWNAGGGILLIFLPKYMTSVGLTEENASLAFSLFGAGSFIGCILGGLLGNIKCCNRIILYIFGNIGVGLLTLLISLPYFHSFASQLFLVLGFGLLFGIILGLLVVVTSDLLGTEALGYGFGYLMLANGIGIFSGPPIAGAVIDNLGYQEPAIFISGAFTLFGGIVMCVVPLSRCCRKQENKQTTGLTISVNKTV